ncbi:MAG: hypothetical protein PHD67_05275 [Oscillospiraceae bacterium]|nr:hypothetical protein [Oscillospiraceae bacterium]
MIRRIAIKMGEKPAKGLNSETRQGQFAAAPAWETLQNTGGGFFSKKLNRFH